MNRFDPQIGTALSAVHDSVSTPWTVESLAATAGMSRSAFAARIKELLGTDTAGIRNRVADAEGDAVTRTA